MCSNRSNHVQIPGAAYSCHMRFERFGDLHCECTHAPSRSINQYLLSRLNLPVITKPLESGQRCDWYGSGLLKRQAVGLIEQFRLGCTCIRGKCPTANPENFIALLESCYFPADPSTCPATSRPGRAYFGLRNRKAKRPIFGLPFIRCESSGLTPAARTPINTSSS